MTSAKSLELYFVEGRPDGMLTAEVFNWTGHVLRVPRTRLADGLRRREAGQRGVYILLGEDDDGPRAYIGEAEDMATRLKQHAAQKDWWEQAVLITTAGDALHKAHVKYLESRLVETALEVQNHQIDNGNAPARSSLNEAAEANMESFLETLHIVLPAIRVDLFQSGRRYSRTDTAPPPEVTDVHDFEFNVARHGLKATARLVGDEMVVRSGSIVRREWIGDRKHNSHYWKLHDSLVASGIIRSQGSNGVMTEDYAFSSPSAAAAIVAGRSANGRTAWRLPDGRTYAEWEQTQLGSNLHDAMAT